MSNDLCLFTSKSEASHQWTGLFFVLVKSSYIWMLRDVFINFSGTTKTNNLDANVESLKVKLTAEDLKEIASQIRAEDVAGGRQYSSYAHTSWKYADTPKK